MSIKSYERSVIKMGLKSTIYKFLRIWNDVDAIRKGKIGKRVGRRASGKITGKAIRKLFK
ncbi:hypothetical protein GH754_09350 [Salinibacillus xinjiangensis]|uniref:Uncharacterized protein n=1 Tax=Salinibacillus xinjiangensis TaxID=1229268 RepID=A0A6G1X6K3_9BACI|nr:hypothetical protein [Salinibacillus xinjiangensis]